MQGRFRGASILPGERQLASLMNVSRTTLRHALAELINEGLLSQRHGMGTFVNDASPPAGDNRPVYRPLDYYGLNGRVDTMIEISRHRHDPSVDEAMAFGLGARDDVVRHCRVIIRQARPDAVEHWSAPADLMAGSDRLEQSLSEAVAAHNHVILTRLQRLRMTTLDDLDAGHLNLQSKAPAICLQEAYYLPQGRCCVLNRAIYPAERLDALFHASLPVDGAA